MNLEDKEKWQNQIGSAERKLKNKIKLIYDFFRLWIKWRDRKEAWEDAKFIIAKYERNIPEDLNYFLTKLRQNYS